LGFYFKSPGSTKNLTNNYRSTYEIASLSNDLEFLDQNAKRMNPTAFKAHGEKPLIVKYKLERELLKYLVSKIKAVKRENSESTICVIHRNDEAFKIKGGSTKLENSNLTRVLKQNFQKVCNEKQYSTKNINDQTIFVFDPYDIKGLEFDYVFIYNFNDSVYPYKAHLTDVLDLCGEKEGDCQRSLDYIDFIDSEKKLLYVAMTRARVGLEFLIYGERKVSRFASEFNPKNFNVRNIRKMDILDTRK